MLPVDAILRPWTYYFDHQPLLVLPTDLSFYGRIRKLRGSTNEARSVVATKKNGEHYAIRWDAEMKTLAGRVCADSFGKISFSSVKEAEEVIAWHEAWENPARDARYHELARTVAQKERQQLGLS